ncbi:MAG TPA: ATP-binding protein [Solirubrobacteraceae bacterium]|nr:ATP-binding protein [Solirubrobacteraceae bacterium]
MDASASGTASRQQPSRSVGDLRLWDSIVDHQHRTGDVEQRFIAERDLPACVVMAEGRVLGVLSRKSLLAALSKPMGRDVYIKRSVAQLCSVMDTAPLILPAATTIAAAVEQALTRPGERSYEPVLVERGASLGILEVDVLMRVQSSLLEEAIRAKDELIEEVQRTADELRTALESLGQARDRLVQSEKMAALGQLVAGVAHEINTPIGVALTAATHLGERTGEFRQSFTENRMKRSELQAYMDLAGESADLLRYNIQRAAQLIQSFKQVAVDQASEQHRSFELKSYLEQLIASLAPEVRKAGHSLTMTCEEGIELTSYPGALAQVLSNLVSNAIVHAYERGTAGTIALAAAPEGADVALTVSDNGRGIPPEDLSRIYDPFFTTRRGAGGTGLGLHIVYNIITETLHGRILCRSTPGQGTSFTAVIPLNTPL